MVVAGLIKSQQRIGAGVFIPLTYTQ